MTIEIQDGRYFAAIWFVGPGVTPDGRRVDLHGALWRDPESHWVLQYRFRYIRDARVDASSEDEKSWYRGDLKSVDAAREEEIVARITRAFEQMAATMGRKPEEVATVLVRSAVSADVMSALASQSWGHMRFEGMTGDGGDA